MRLKQNDIWDAFMNAETEEKLERVREELETGGYSVFNAFLHRLKEKFAEALEEDLGQIKVLLERGRTVLPDPIRLSPSWEKIWDEYDRMISYKEEALRAVPIKDRDGEWQVVMDNPYTNDAISCYPGLSFIEASYLYAYFRKDLKPNEYIRLQKISNLLISSGN